MNLFNLDSMNYFKIIFVTGMITVTMVSCQKENDGDPVIPPVIDSTYPSQIISLDTNYTTGLDTAYITKFVFDAQKRIQLLVNEIVDNGVSYPASHSALEEYTYSYNGSEVLPYKLARKYTNYSPLQISYDTLFFTYSEGFVSRDSIPNGLDYKVYELNKVTSASYRIRTKTYTNTTHSLSIDTAYGHVNWSGGNLISETDSTWIRGLNSWFIKNRSFNYDSHINPLSKFIIPFPVPGLVYFADNSFNSFSTSTLNNLIHVQDNSGSADLNYTYNAAGLPVIIRQTGGYKTILRYIHL